MNPNAFDDSIPVLTEVLAPAATVAAAPAAKAPAPEQLEELDLAALERRLTERVLQGLQSRVDFVLEQRVRDAMAEVLQHALHDLTTELRSGLQQTLEAIVTRAVAQELAHLRAHKAS